jgi:hypothetical protein
MRKKSGKSPCCKIVLRLPDLDHAKSAVNSLRPPAPDETTSSPWSISLLEIALNRSSSAGHRMGRDDRQLWWRT